MISEDLRKQHESRSPAQCNDCTAIEGGPIEGCDYCHITVPYNGKFYTQKNIDVPCVEVVE